MSMLDAQPQDSDPFATADVLENIKNYSTLLEALAQLGRRQNPDQNSEKFSQKNLFSPKLCKPNLCIRDEEDVVMGSDDE
ncbi:hypothetical protein Slin15195_G060290 [Septoria linicola]|uniref:Uncharacterized protein n=1 Tax=Septoria linicola TaxID=215465 RepID=A0A9Q9EJ70_9PEZI|nr:hypothetical protein Slin15195_G060290 [Septoria linicola]